MLSVSQEFGEGLVGQLWLGVWHAAVCSQMEARAETGKIGTGAAGGLAGQLAIFISSQGCSLCSLHRASLGCLPA